MAAVCTYAAYKATPMGAGFVCLEELNEDCLFAQAVAVPLRTLTPRH